MGMKYIIESLRVYSLILMYMKNRIRETRGLKKSEMTFEILCNNEDCFSSIIKFKNQIYHYNLKNQTKSRGVKGAELCENDSMSVAFDKIKYFSAFLN